MTARVSCWCARMIGIVTGDEKLINHKSYRTFKDTARSCSTSLSNVVDAENKRQRIERERAVATRARNKAYWQTFKAREGEGNGINRI